MLSSAVNTRTLSMVLWCCPVLSSAGQVTPNLLMSFHTQDGDAAWAVAQRLQPIQEGFLVPGYVPSRLVGGVTYVAHSPWEHSPATHQPVTASMGRQLFLGYHNLPQQMSSLGINLQHRHHLKNINCSSKQYLRRFVAMNCLFYNTYIDFFIVRHACHCTSIYTTIQAGFISECLSLQTYSPHMHILTYS